MEENTSGFWEALIVEWVAIGLFAFILQGVWFGLTSFLAERQPAWEASLASTSSSFLVVWLAATLAALAWSVKRARDRR